jgi:hypothetical protein
MSTVTATSFKPKATRKRLKKEILSDDFKKRNIFWKNIAENFLWKIFHLTSLVQARERVPVNVTDRDQVLSEGTDRRGPL